MVEMYSKCPEIACPEAAEDIKALVRFAKAQGVSMRDGNDAPAIEAWRALPAHLRDEINSAEPLTPTPAQSATPPAEADEAVIELRQAVEGGNDMPWSMVGIRWTTAKRLLEMVEQKQ